jgi:DinB family protein
MATFSNPAGQAKPTGSAYIQLLLDTLGDQEPLPIHESTPAKLRRAITGLDGATLRRPEKPGKWSILQVIQHLADSELVYGYRIRMIASHPTPDIQGFDQDLWAKELDYQSVDPGQSLEDFRTQREANVRLLRSLGAQKLGRFGNHSERGKESIARMMKLYAAHDLVHLQQIERIKAAVQRKA